MPLPNVRDWYWSCVRPCFSFSQSCLQQWIKSSETRKCELCKFEFIMETKIKPFQKWEKLQMTTVERRKIMCSVTFHAIAITCVIWSLYVLIDRTTDEIRKGENERDGCRHRDRMISSDTNTGSSHTLDCQWGPIRTGAKNCPQTRIDHDFLAALFFCCVYFFKARSLKARCSLGRKLLTF